MRIWVKCGGLIVYFKKKTEYEMRISDWSSDVCSSDLVIGPKREIYGACASIWPKGELKGGRQICRPKSTTRFATLVSIGSRTKTAVALPGGRDNMCPPRS